MGKTKGENCQKNWKKNWLQEQPDDDDDDDDDDAIALLRIVERFQRQALVSRQGANLDDFALESFLLLLLLLLLLLQGMDHAWYTSWGLHHQEEEEEEELILEQNSWTEFLEQYSSTEFLEQNSSNRISSAEVFKQNFSSTSVQQSAHDEN
jgi:hypothetical protein